jgi:hypothetical protein
MQMVPDDMNHVGTFRYIGDTVSDVKLNSQLAAFGAARVTEDAAWCRYALEASRRGEPLSVVV